jgi:hypothetical protein
MSDRADMSLEQSPIPRLGELQIAQFIGDALRAGQRAILVTGRGHVSMRVPQAALTAGSSTSARALHIGPPLPEPPELQEMIGAAVGVVGGREMTPEAMARLLRFADPRPRVILAIDDAHTLSHRSLGYLTLMTELLASEPPILQVVLAARPSLLDTLAQPEFETLRDRLCRPLFETIQTLRGKRANGAVLGLQKPTHGPAPTRLAHVQNGGTAALSPRDHRIVRPAVRAAVGLVAMSGLAAIGYLTFPALFGPTLPDIPSLNSDAPQRFLTPSGPSQTLAELGPSQIDEGNDPLIDETVDAVARGPVELTSTLVKGIAELEFSALPDRPKLMLALRERLAARMAAAVVAGRLDEARRLEQVFRLTESAIGRPESITASNQRSFQSPLTAIPDASGAGTSGLAQQREIAQRPGFPPDSSAVSAGQPSAEGGGGRAALSPPNAPRAAPKHNVSGAPPAILAPSLRPDGPGTVSADQPGAAGDGDRAALSENAASLAQSRAAPEQNVDEAPRATMAKTPPIASDDHKPRILTDLPTFAPVRVVLNVARGDVGRAADIQHALVAAGVETNLVPIDARQPTPRIGYYFRADRSAAAGVSQLLTPLLGTVDPVALRIQGSIPEPGTIEIAIP